MTHTHEAHLFVRADLTNPKAPVETTDTSGAWFDSGFTVDEAEDPTPLKVLLALNNYYWSCGRGFRIGTFVHSNGETEWFHLCK